MRLYSTNLLRRLLSSYHTMHASVHAKNAHLKVHHCMSRDSSSLAWLTPVFELYCIAGAHASRNALAQSANKIVQWVRREEERIFIIGGAVSSASKTQLTYMQMLIGPTGVLKESASTTDYLSAHGID